MTATAQYAIPGAIIPIMLFFRLRSVGKARRGRMLAEARARRP